MRYSAFGDGENDVEMFEVVSYGIAVANAKPMLKDAARFITEANSENGVGKALDTIVEALASTSTSNGGKDKQQC
jgi:hydroxymethylpyrimidine pyrophosphatase-like HAD family hydrolase